MVVMMMGSGAATALGSLRTLDRLCTLAGLRALTCLRALRGLKSARLSGLAKLLRHVAQKLGLGTARLTRGALKSRGELSRHRLELGGVLLRELLHLAE